MLSRASFKVVGRLPALRRALMARLARSVRRRPGRVLAGGFVGTDERYLHRPEVRNILVEALSEAFRSGSRGAAWEFTTRVR